MKEVCAGAYLASAPLQPAVCRGYSEVPALWMATMGREDMRVPLFAAPSELPRPDRVMDGEEKTIGQAGLGGGENDCAGLRICGCAGRQITSMILAFEFFGGFRIAKISRFGCLLYARVCRDKPDGRGQSRMYVCM